MKKIRMPRAYGFFAIVSERKQEKSLHCFWPSGTKNDIMREIDRREKSLLLHSRPSGCPCRV